MRKLLDRIKGINFDFKVFFIILILILNLILIFRPQILKNKSSYASIRTKKAALESANTDILSEVEANNKKTVELVELRERDQDYEHRALKNRKEVDLNGLEFHLPSILIRLEDSSNRNKLELEVDYSEISYENLDGEPVDGEGSSLRDRIDQDIEDIQRQELEKTEDDEIDEDLKKLEEEYLEDDLTSNLNEQLREEDQDQPEEDDGSLKLKSDVEAEEEEEERLLALERERTKNLDEATNVEVTKIPIKVTGNYNGVRGFIKDLDRLNYIEPSRINMESLGDTVTADIIISVFHGDIFGEI